MKIDSSGNEIWSNIHEDWGAAILRSCQPVGNDGYILSGFTYADDALLARINNSGDTLWSRIYGGSEADKFWSARPTSDGGFIVAGWTESFGNGGSDFYILKTDQNGDSIWTRTYGGQYRNEEAREIMETPDGGFVFSGKSAVSYDSYLYYFMKISSQGDSLWSFTDSAYVWPGILHSFTPAASGGYAAIGYALNTIDVFRISHVGGLYWSTSFLDDSVVVGYARSIIQSEDNGFFLCGNNGSDIWVAKLAPDIVGVEDDIVSLPKDITLHQNYPNPFNASTTISFELPEQRDVNLTIYDLLGRKITVLLDEPMNAGTHQAVFNADDYSSGVYLYNLKTGDINETRSMILLK
jgi:hypothetical protein